MSEVLESPPPYLTAAEVDGLCEGLSQNAAKVRYLRKLGLHVTVKPNGAPHVARSEYERVCGAGRVATTARTVLPGSEPDAAAALSLLNERKARHGAQTQRR